METESGIAIVISIMAFILALASLVMPINLIENQQQYYVIVGVTNAGTPYYNKMNTTTLTWSGYVGMGGTLEEIVCFNVKGNILFVLGRNAGDLMYYKIFNLTDDSVIQDYTFTDGVLYQHTP